MPPFAVKFRPATRPTRETRQPFRLDHQGIRQPAACHRNMHDVIATEYPSQFHSRHRRDHRDRLAAQKPVTLFGAAIGGLTSSPARPFVSQSRALAKPPTACPARRASPRRSRTRRIRPACRAVVRSSGTVTGPRAARAKAPLAQAVSSTSPRALNQIPRPGRRCGKIRHDNTRPGRRRIAACAAARPRSRVTTQRRSGPAFPGRRRPRPPRRPPPARHRAFGVIAPSIAAQLRAVRRRCFPIEPMGAGGHDDLVRRLPRPSPRRRQSRSARPTRGRPDRRASSPLFRQAPPASPAYSSRSPRPRR